MDDFGTVKPLQVLQNTAAALKSNGMEATVVENAQATKETVLRLIPPGQSVMTESSVTLETSGIREALETGPYVSIRRRLQSLDRDTQHLEMNRLAAAPQWAIGSAHAITRDGKILIASNTGSQLPAYAYAAGKIIFVVGGQKVVQSFDEGIKRIYEYVLPRESERINKTYNLTTGSFVSKLLVINREIQAGRITVFLVSQNLGF